MKAPGLRTLLSAAVVTSVVGCVFQPVARRASIASPEQVITPAYDLDPAAPLEEPAVVQVFEYPRSPTVAVIAWRPGDSGYGLRSWLRRDGSLVRDHRFYVSTFYDGGTSSHFANSGMRKGAVETVTPAGLLLESAGTLHDVHACHGWPDCTPFVSRLSRIPDSLLRANRDSLAVRLYGRGGTELTVTVRRDVIDAYLRTVDSVAATLRRGYARAN